MPAIAIPLGALGIVPFILFGLGAVGHIPASAERMLVALIDYAALMLTFAGGVHWGMGLSPMVSRPALRLGAGTVPLLIAWIALILAQMISPLGALALLCVGYLATILVEHRASRQWLIPRNYVWLRWAISVVGLVMMVIVIVLRALNQTIVF
ncbi:MAG TPA: DUF3429 domain-containing protein [Rhodopila sp.]|nr:DUF3429 domain-containing protein [Rhodopila sp.]